MFVETENNFFVEMKHDNAAALAHFVFSASFQVLNLYIYLFYDDEYFFCIDSKKNYILQIILIILAFCSCMSVCAVF
jgi:hypothetical protein